MMPASIAPVPLTVRINTSLVVWCSHLSLAVTSAMTLLKSPLRCPMGAFARANSACSGTGVGPGIININLSSMSRNFKYLIKY